MPVALATGTATFIGRSRARSKAGVRGACASANRQPSGSSFPALLLFALLGAIIGVAATVFVWVLPFAEDQFDRIKNPYLRHAIGMALVGILFLRAISQLWDITS